jgi:hypothetical protein
MVALQIRDVPEDVRQSLAGLAASRGQSLQAYLLTLVTEEARRWNNLALLDRFGARVDGSRLTVEDVVAAIERARTERDTRLGEVLGDQR